jgi:hypothetical protein
MSNRLSNHEIERHYFEKFRAVYSLPSGDIDYGDKPDIILKGTRTIGIEVTRFYLASGNDFDSEQRQKPLRDVIVKEAQKLYQGANGRGIELWIGFDPTMPITSDRKKALPMEIADLAKRMDRKNINELFQPLLPKPPEINAVYFTGDDYTDPHWRVFQGSSLTHMSVDALEEIVRSKEIKANQYKPCDSYWLLVVVDWMDSAQEQEIRVDNLNIRSDIFERIFVYKPGYDHIVEAKSQ